MSITVFSAEGIMEGLGKALNFPIEEVIIAGDGFRSMAVEVNREYIFLIGKVPQAAKTYSKEYRILPLIQPLLPVEIPNPKWFAESIKAFPYGFLGYPKIEGTILTRERIAKADLQDLAQDLDDFLSALHRLEVVPLHLELPDFFREDKRLRDEVLPTLKQRLNSNEYRRIAQWWEVYLSEEENFNFEPKLVHGDFWHENYVMDDDLHRLTGVIDFEAFGLCDPACDFAPLHYIGSGFLEEVLSKYIAHSKIGAAPLRKRIQRQWEKRELYGLRYAIRNDDDEALRDSIGKIRKGPIFK